MALESLILFPRYASPLPLPSHGAFTDCNQQVVSNSKYSRLGMVVVLQNKWTNKDKQYIFEVTRNVGHMADAFSEKFQSGPCLFRLDERIHAINATEVFWVPLKEPLDQSAGEQNMKDYLRELHIGRERLPDLVLPHPEILHFFNQFEFHLENPKHLDTLCELNSTTIMVNALRCESLPPTALMPSGVDSIFRFSRLGGKRFNFEKEFYPPVQLLALNVFEEPILLRSRKDVPYDEPPNKRRTTVADDKRLTDVFPRA